MSGFAEVGHRGCLIEIELTASTAHENFGKTIADWPMSPPFAAPAAVRAGDLIFYSGILGINKDCRIVTEPEDFDLAPEIPEGLGLQLAVLGGAGRHHWPPGIAWTVPAPPLAPCSGLPASSAW